MKKEIKNIIKKNLHWVPLPSSDRDFVTEMFPKEMCFLRMNNFPDEPLWTLFYGDFSLDFDDTPKNWTVKYRSEN